MGVAFQSQGNLNDAIDSYKRVLKLKPNFAEAHSNLGVALRDNGELDAAIEHYYRAIKIRPNYVDALNNLGVALKDKGELNAAIDSHQLALKLEPNCAETYYNLGVVQSDKADPDAAIECYKKAVKISPNNAEAQHNLSLELLKIHKFQQGFKLQEWRWKANQMIGKPLETLQPRWNGEKNKRVFIWREQGIGDEIMFASLIHEIYAISSKLIVNCDKRLISLFQRSFPKDIIYQSDRSLVTDDLYDFHIPIGSLPCVFRTTIKSFPKIPNGYLRQDEAKTHQLRQKLLMGEADTLIGISWLTTSAAHNSINRNIALPELAQALSSSKIQLVCLQYGDVSDQINRLKKEFGINIIQVSEIDNKKDIDGLASLIMACDKVVSVANATIHLAGALGADATVLLPFSARWLWGTNQLSSYWYTSVTPWRQKTIGDWSSLLKSLSSSMKIEATDPK